MQIASVQKVILYITLLLVPSFIIPLPWGWADYAKGILMLFLFITYVTLELVKTISLGKISMFKSGADLALLLIAISLLLSTVFSQDFSVSLWGFDMRLATGGLVLLLTILFFIFARSVVSSRADLTNIVYAALAGIGISALISLMGYLGINIFQFSSVASKLFVSGVSTYASSDVAVLMWGSGVILTILTFVWERDNRTSLKTGIALVAGLITVLALVIYSMAVPLALVLLIVVTTGSVVALVFMQRNDNLKDPALYGVILFGILAIGVILARVEPVQKIIINNGSLSAQVKLEGEDAWQVVSESLTNSISTGLLGVGVDTYAIYYNSNRPAISKGVDLSQTTLTNASSELLNIVGNQGVIGALLWLAVGFLVLSSIYKDFIFYKENPRYTNLVKLIFSIAPGFLYIASFVTYWGFAGYFMFSVVVALSASTRAILDPQNSESYSIKLDMFVESLEKGRNRWSTTILGLVILFLGFLALYAMNGWSRGAWYALRAESQIVSLQERVQNSEDLENEELASSIADVANMYGVAVDADPSNPVYRRRTALVLIDYTDTLVNELNQQLEGQTPNENGEYDLNDEQQAIRAEVNSAVEAAVDQAETATEKDPNIFANWNVRGYVYSKVVGYGYAVYVDQGINAIAGHAIRLNPLDNIQYQRLAQLYIAKEDVESAVIAVNTGLQINPNHLPTLLLASELAVAVEEYQDALNLLDRAKLVLEALALEESELYTYVIERIDAVKEGIEGGEIEENLDPDVLEDEILLEEDPREENDLESEE